MSFHLVFLILGCITIAGTLASLRREHIRTEYSVSWLAVGVVIVCLALFPRLWEGTAKRLSLDPALCFAIIGGALVAALVFEMSHVVSRLRDENVMLAQRIAILEFQMRREREQSSKH